MSSGIPNTYSRVGSWAFDSDNQPPALPGYTQANRYSQNARPNPVTTTAFPTHGNYPTSALRTDRSGIVPCDNCPQSHETAKRAMYEAYLAQIHQQQRNRGTEGNPYPGYFEGSPATEKRSLRDILADPELQSFVLIVLFIILVIRLLYPPGSFKSSRKH
jgi:hypothetical protein